MSYIRVILLTIIFSVLSTLSCLWIYDNYFTGKHILVSQELYAPKVQFTDFLLNQDFTNKFAKTSPNAFVHSANISRPAVVYIEANNYTKDEYPRRVNQASGSGVITSPEGYIVTNNHVIENSTDISVTLNDRRTYSAKVIGIDPSTDLALLKIEAEDLPFLLFGDSDSVQVGEWVMAVGNPFRLQSTVTAGIVSAKGRDIDILDLDYGIESFIQTDAAVNNGNSGGALVNIQGNLIGISTAILTFTGRYEGYSFAIPSNLVKKVIYDLKEFGSVHRGLLGIEGNSVVSEQAKRLNLPAVAGVYVSKVNRKSGAHEAGILASDVITEVNDKKVITMSDLLEVVGRYHPGDKIAVTIWRGGAFKEKTIELKNRLNTTDLVTIRKDKMLSDLGIEVRDLIQSEKEETKLKGVKVISIYKGSKVSKTKMEPGYIITSVNDKIVKNADELIKELADSEGRIFLEGHYEKHGGPWWYAFEK